MQQIVRYLIFKQTSGDKQQHGTGLLLEENILITSHPLFDDLAHYYLSPDGTNGNLTMIEGEEVPFRAAGTAQTSIEPFVYEIKPANRG